MVLSREYKRILIIIAVVALLAAAVLLLSMGGTNELKSIAGMLNGYGYSLTEDDIAAIGSQRDTTIAIMLKDDADTLAEAVEASRKTGFPSDVDKQGDITLLATEPSDNEVILIFMVGEEIEMCFSQTPDGKTVFPIGQKDGAQ